MKYQLVHQSKTQRQDDADKERAFQAALAELEAERHAELDREGC